MNAKDRFTWDDEGDFAVTPTPSTQHDTETCSMCTRLAYMSAQEDTRAEALRLTQIHLDTIPHPKESE